MTMRTFLAIAFICFVIMQIVLLLMYQKQGGHPDWLAVALIIPLAGLYVWARLELTRKGGKS